MKRATKMIGAVPHNIWAETKGAPFVQVEEEKAEEGDLIAVSKYLMGCYKKKRWSQTLCRYSVKELEAMDTSFSKVNSDCIEGKKPKIHNDTCLDRLQSLCLWKYSKLNWKWS